MDQYSFHGPFAYRWIDDVPVERIDLRSGERLAIEVISGAIPPALGAASAEPMGPRPKGSWEDQADTTLRAAMAAWN